MERGWIKIVDARNRDVRRLELPPEHVGATLAMPCNRHTGNRSRPALANSATARRVRDRSGQGSLGSDGWTRADRIDQT